MPKDLTNSRIDRQNVLNNEIAVQEIQVSSNIQGIHFENDVYLTKNMVAQFFNVDSRTIERCVSDYADELIKNGYEILRGNRLKSFIKTINEQDVADMNVGNISTKTPQLGIFNFKAFLNIAMLLTESDVAKSLRQMMLDIAIDIINKKTGGGTKYINQRDKDFIASFSQENCYRREFTEALKNYVDMGNSKYAVYTDKIYVSIFKEKSREYRKILSLSAKEGVRNTLYAEILNLIASYECGLAASIKEQAEQKNRKLTNWELETIFSNFEKLPLWKPLLENARKKMASRDLALRDAFHQNLEEYIIELPPAEYDKFLGEEAITIEKLMEEHKDILKRLKERE